MVFGRPFIKRFALCYQAVACPVCLSVLSLSKLNTGRLALRAMLPLTIADKSKMLKSRPNVCDRVNVENRQKRLVVRAVGLHGYDRLVDGLSDRTSQLLDERLAQADRLQQRSAGEKYLLHYVLNIRRQ